MLLRNQKESDRGEKRQIIYIAGGDAAQPDAKRAAISEIQDNLSNFVLDSSKKTIVEKPCDQKSRLLHVKSVVDYDDDIFNYYKIRQTQFPIKDYMKNQRYMSVNMRAAIINWLVNVQEQFEFNHETLYLSVKITDIYLSRTQNQVHRDNLQVIAGTAFLLAAKFDNVLHH